jgi:hypothetical protein
LYPNVHVFPLFEGNCLRYPRDTSRSCFASWYESFRLYIFSDWYGPQGVKLDVHVLIPWEEENIAKIPRRRCLVKKRNGRDIERSYRVDGCGMERNFRLGPVFVLGIGDAIQFIMIPGAHQCLRWLARTFWTNWIGWKMQP